MYAPQTKILEGRVYIRERIFKALFTYVSTRFGRRSFEKCFENAFPNVCSAFQNLRLGTTKWHQNVQSHWQTIRRSNPSVFTPEWHRMWTFYLLSCMVAFEAKKLYLTQSVLTKKAFDGMVVFPSTQRRNGRATTQRLRRVPHNPPVDGCTRTL